MSHGRADVVLSLDLAVRGDWADVERVRTSVWNCLTAAFGADDLRDALAMVTAELLENAVKHGDPGCPGLCSRLSVLVSGERGVVCVESCATTDTAARVMELLAWLRGFPSSAEAYRAKLIEVASTTGDGSGLGLARIAYEGGCTLSASRDGNTLTIRAERALAR